MSTLSHSGPPDQSFTSLTLVYLLITSISESGSVILFSAFETISKFGEIATAPS